ncbi:MAG: baseplate J/gp47 family protein [Candidatus Andersenbacteria bacterium]|nr:baseplate J/gp47 family protein [Candidatus Andersenbacteria bacterium]
MAANKRTTKRTDRTSAKRTSPRKSSSSSTRAPSSKKKRKRTSSFPWRVVLIAFLSVLVVFGGIVAAIYLSLAQAVITLVPVQQQVTTTFQLDLGEDTVVEEGQTVRLAGTLFDRQIEETKTIEQIDKQEIESQARGTVRFVNNKNGPVRLIAGTQLKPEGRDLIFRTQDVVVIPTEGTVEAEIVADDIGEIGQVPASTWEIIKLAEAWKVDVYAESDDAMKGGRVTTEVLTEPQIEVFREQFTNELRDRVLRELVSEHPGLTFPENGAIVEVGQVDANVPAGERATDVTLTANIRLVAFAFYEHALLDVALQRLKQEVQDGYVFQGVTPDSFSYVIDAYNVEAGTATVTVSIAGTAIADVDPSSFDRETLVGRDALEAANYFEQFETIESADVYFTPFWTDTVPRLNSHTEIVVDEPDPTLEPGPEAVEPDPLPLPASAIEEDSSTPPNEETLPSTE